MLDWIRRLFRYRESGHGQPAGYNHYKNSELALILAAQPAPYIGDFGKAKRECRAYSPALDFDNAHVRSVIVVNNPLTPNSNCDTL